MPYVLYLDSVEFTEDGLCGVTFGWTKLSLSR